MPALSKPSEAPACRKIWLALLPALLLPTLSALFYFVIFDEAAMAKPIYLATKVFTVLWPIFATVLILRLRIRLGPMTAEHRRSLLPGLAIGLAILGVMVIWMNSPWAEFILSGGEKVRDKVKSLGFLDHFIFFAIFITLVHSFVEEFYWRWFVFGNLRKVLPLPAAHGIAAIGFAAHHLVVTCQYYSFGFALFLAFCVAVGGLIWSLLYQRYGSLLGAWLCHLFVDAGLMWVGYQMIFPNGT
ncbi:MAG: membrane protease YdiL (CAAX protease family) [Verrucomicrobiales bacterium]|jgi:membrane protease YdiL (CAAX protease family)